MANNKSGFDFYRVDTDRYQDIRIKKLKKHHGCNGIAVYDYMLCEIYRVKGCFLEWDESTTFDVAEYFGLKETTVNEIMRYCGSVGLFDKELLSRGIVTSEAIQKRYIGMCRIAKRQQIEIPEQCRISSVQQPVEQPTPIQRPVAQQHPAPQQTQQTPTDNKPTAQIHDLIHYVDEDDYWEAMRLSSCGKPNIATDSFMQWINDKKRGAKTYEFYEIIQYMQRLENNGQLTPEQPNRLLWRALVDIRRTVGVFTSQQINELYGFAQSKPNDFIAVVNEWKKNKTKINAPFQFIKSKLK